MQDKQASTIVHFFDKPSKIRVFMVIYSQYLLFSILAHLVGPEWPDELIPSLWIMMLWAVPVYIFTSLKVVLNKIVCLIWMLWFFVGSVNVIASYLHYGDYYLIDVQLSNFVYVAYTSVMFTALLLVESTMATRDVRDKAEEAECPVLSSDLPWMFASFLYIFPYVWFVSVYYSVGYIPLFSGVNIEYNMYESDFGILYGYAGVNVLSMIFLMDKVQSARSRLSRYGYLSSLVVVGLISAMTGKRMVLIIFMLAALCYWVSMYKARSLRWWLLVKGGVLFAVSYVGLMAWRKGIYFDAFAQSIEQQLSVVGAEYRDFIYAVDRFTAYDLYDHNWAASTLVSGLNSRVLGLFGVNKQEVLETALGYVSKPLFMGGDFGVRTGLVSELFLAYSFWGVIIIFFFGLLVGWLNRNLYQGTSKISTMYMSAIYGILATAIVAQSIDIVGTITVWFYTWILYKGSQMYGRGGLSDRKMAAPHMKA